MCVDPVILGVLVDVDIPVKVHNVLQENKCPTNNMPQGENALIDEWTKDICALMGADACHVDESIQTLWSGYGEIVRASLIGADMPSVILKYIAPPDAATHPRGWNTNRSHQRKLRSYEVEAHWYTSWSQRCDERCRVPRCYGVLTRGAERLLLLEDLDAAGFDLRYDDLDLKGASACLTWLAAFHARWLGHVPNGLWPIGTYWHLDTRPDEWEAMQASVLKQAASALDVRLQDCVYSTLVHGDAKVANFCFSPDGAVAAVDFQYVGGGCGMKDVAYFLGSCLDEGECALWESELLDVYFDALRLALLQGTRKVSIDVDALEAEWRSLYDIAWADFTRFLLGWMPSHRKLHAYSQQLTRQALHKMGFDASDF